MIETSFLDRVPTYPGRVVLSPVDGQPDTYDMTRADQPTEAGTPIDKATFDSMVHSRLTGRFYAPTVSREVQSSVVGVADPIPASGWMEISYTELTNGNYKVTSTASDYPNLPDHAFNNSTTTYWAGENATGQAWIAIDLGTRILVTKLSVCWFSYDYDSLGVSFQGSNNGTEWVEIANTTGNRETPTDWDFSNYIEYSQYRLVFTQGTEDAIRLYDWSITGWSVSTYKNVFTVDNGFPSEWTTGQRVTIETPSNVNTVGVLFNSINGVNVQTILQPSKRYELRYTGSAFVAKEV